MTRETALIIPASGLPPLIEDLRRRFDPSAVAGVPAHLTILYPFLEPRLVTRDRMRELMELVSGFPAFAYALVALRAFGDGTVYLAPEPQGPFIALSEAVSGRFGVAPYGGAHADVVPHLTVAQAAGETERRKVEATIAPLLPLHAAATAAWLLAGSNDTAWSRWRSFELGG